jgi:hypothetical protein
MSAAGRKRQLVELLFQHQNLTGLRIFYQLQQGDYLMVQPECSLGDKHMIYIGRDTVFNTHGWI